MPTLPDSPNGPFKPLFFLCLALLPTPSIVAVASLYWFLQPDIAVVLAHFLDFGTSPEMIAAALLAVATGVAFYGGVALLTQRKPSLADMLVIALSQLLSWLGMIAEFIHNPQEEYCRASLLGSALAKAFQLDSCSLTIHFWKQAAIGGFVSAIFLVLVLHLGRAFIHGVSQGNKG